MPPEKRADILRPLKHLSLEEMEEFGSQLCRIEWLGPVDMTPDEALAKAKTDRDPNKVKKCAEWMKTFLAIWAYPSQEILAAAKEGGYTFDNVKEAKVLLKEEGLQNSNAGRFSPSWWSGFGPPDTWKLRPSGHSGVPD